MSTNLTGPWAAHQLAEFLAVVSGCESERAALTVAVERAAEAFEAEIAAVFRGPELLHAVGLATPGDHYADLLAASTGAVDTLTAPGVGACTVVWHDHDGTVRLMVARRHDDPFGPEEAGLLRSLVRVLTLTLSNFRLLDSLRERQTLLERLSVIQRSISHRAELTEILSAITTGLSELFADGVTMMRLIDEDDATRHLLVASHGLPADVAESVRCLPISSGPGGHAIRDGALVVTGDLRTSPDYVAALDLFGVTTMMAAPVHEGGTIVGAVVVGSRQAGRTYTASEQETLQAFAEHASLALTDAQALAEMQRSRHDPLTKLPNRSLFNDRLSTALADPSQAAGVAVLFVDLDRFKSVNDSLGHAAGDDVLVCAAGRIAAQVRPTDTVARFGGDEFTVLLSPAHGLLEVEAIADRIKAALSEPMVVAGRELVITASIGIALHDTLDGGDTDLVNAADVAMYQAKASGRGGSQVFVPALGVRARRRLDVETALRAALDNGDLRLMYQPLIDVCGNGDVMAVEGLLRWERTALTDASVPETIAVAEETGLIHQIGAWAIDEACRQAALWRDTVLLPTGILPSIHVNLSGHQLRDPGIVRAVSAALARHRLAADLLTLEITESVLIGNDEPSLDGLRALRELGVRLSLDDFGKGYSSLAYLAELDIQSLKIDQRFVQRLGLRNADVVVRHVIGMAQQLGMIVVGEGVETPDQLRLLRSLGCDLAQGYLFSRALPPDEVSRLFAGAAPFSEPLAVSSAM